MMKGLQKNVSIICLSRELEATILEFMMECHMGHSFEEETFPFKDPLFEEEKILLGAGYFEKLGQTMNEL